MGIEEFKNITTTAVTETKPFTFDDLLKATKLMQELPEPVIKQEVSQAVFDKIKDGTSILPLKKDDRYKLPEGIACCFMGMLIKINKNLPDNVMLLEYKNGRKTMKFLNNGNEVEVWPAVRKPVFFKDESEYLQEPTSLYKKGS